MILHSVADLLAGHPDADDPVLIELVEAVAGDARPGAPLDELRAFICQTWQIYTVQRERARGLILEERLRFADVLVSPAGMADFNLQSGCFARPTIRLRRSLPRSNRAPQPSR